MLTFGEGPFIGTVSRDFLLLVFFVNHILQASDNSIRDVSKFFNNSLRYLQVKVYHRYQRTGGKFATGVNDTGGNDTGGNFVTSTASVVDTGRKFATSVNNTGSILPLVSMTPVANNSKTIRLLTP
jgi:hypothetical protein